MGAAAVARPGLLGTPGLDQFWLHIRSWSETLSHVTIRASARQYSEYMPRVIFTCPDTAMKVQHWLGDDSDDVPADEYEPVDCPACAKVHLINRKTGKLLGER